MDISGVLENNAAPIRKLAARVLLACFAAIPASFTVASPGIIPASLKDQAFLDTNGDGQGDGPGSIQVVEGRVGENLVDATEVRYCVGVVVNNDEAAILAASDNPITLNLYLAGKANTAGASVSVSGLPNRTGEGFSANDFHGPAELVAGSAVTNSTPGGKFVSIDVTDFVKQEVERGARRIGFRLEFRPELPLADGRTNRFTFRSADSENPPFLRYDQ